MCVVEPRHSFSRSAAHPHVYLAMFRRAVLSALLLANITLAIASESEWRAAFDVMWEARWQQNGVWRGVVRWPTTEPKRLTYSINADADNANSERIKAAFDQLAMRAGFSTAQVSSDDGTAQVQFVVRHFRDDELRRNICFMNPWWSNWLYTRVRVELSTREAYRCILHELMHTMGFPGHPRGSTVLSYFEGNQLSLKPIDEFMLRAWHSDAIRPGMPRLEATRVMNRAWITENVTSERRAEAIDVERKWLQEVLESLERFALNDGEPPLALFRSGRLTSEGVAVGRRATQTALGEAYLLGAGLDRNLEKALRLLTLASNAGSTEAITFKLTALRDGLWDSSQALAVCNWLTDATPRNAQEIAIRQQVLSSPPCAKK